MDREALILVADALKSLLRRTYSGLVRLLETRPGNRTAKGAEPAAARFGEYERIEESKFHAGGIPEPLGLESGELPGFSETRVVAMAVNPYSVHLYWDVPPAQVHAAKALLDDRSQAALRFHDITGIDFDGVNAHSSFDVDIDLQAPNWYVDLWSPEKRYCIDLGFRAGDGRFVALARSNTVETPPAWPRVKVDEAPMLVEPERRTPEAAPAPAALRLDNAVVSEPRPSGSGEIPPLAAAVAVAPARAPAPQPAVAPRPVGAGDVLSRKIAEIAALRGPANVAVSASVAIPASVAAPAREGRTPDLTEMSEKQFAPGISSALAARKRPGKGSKRRVLV